MKATGIVRKVDQLGRIVIPKELRKSFDLDSGMQIEIFTRNNTIVFRKYEPQCVICGQSKGTHNFKGKLICNHCIDYIKKAGR